MQTHSVVAEVFHVGGHMDMMIIVAFPNFAKAPNSSCASVLQIKLLPTA